MRCKVRKAIILDRKYNPDDELSVSRQQFEGINRVQPGTLELLEPAGEERAASNNAGEPERITSLPLMPMLDAPEIDSVMPKTDSYMPPLRGNPNINDVSPLLWILGTAAPDRILELGTAHGWTSLLCARYRREATVVTVNALPEQIRGVRITRAFTKDEIGRLFHGTAEEERIEQVYANTLEFDATRHGPFDLAIVDACHDKNFVLSDFHTCLKALSGGGVILLHDVTDGSEPYAACVQLRNEGYDIVQIAGTSWGLFIEGGLSASPLEELFSEVEYAD